MALLVNTRNDHDVLPQQVYTFVVVDVKNVKFWRLLSSGSAHLLYERIELDWENWGAVQFSHGSCSVYKVTPSIPRG